MHILMIPSAYPTKDSPISGIFFKEQASALAKANNKVGVIYSETRRVNSEILKGIKQNYFQTERIVEDGILTYRLHGWNIFTMRFSLGVNLWIRQQLHLFDEYCKNEGKPDIIHVQCGLYAGIVAKIIKEQFHIKYIVTEHSSSILNHELKEYDVKQLRMVYDNADRLVAVGERLRESMQNYTKNKIDIIPNIVNMDNFFINNIDTRNEFKFISVSFLKADKNVDLTIRALGEIVKENEKVKLTIIGDGQDREELKGLAKELGIEKNVEFLGSISRAKLPKYLISSDAFVLPSKYETFGVAYIEAMACGLPIITTACGGPEDFYTEDVGYIVPVGDLTSLIDSMKRMIKNVDLFDNEKISNNVKKRFSKEVVVESLMNLYKSELIK